MLRVDTADPPLLERAQRYERDALETLLEGSLEPLLALSVALTGNPAGGLALAELALGSCLDRLPRFHGGTELLHIRLLDLAARAVPAPPRGGGLRDTLARQPPAALRLIALRVLAGVSSERLAAALGSGPGGLRRQLVQALRALAGQPPGAGPPDGDSLESFDAAVSRVVAGVAPAAAAASVTVPSDVRALLGTVAELAKLARQPGGGPPDAEPLRRWLLSAATERRVGWAQRRPGPSVPGLGARGYLLRKEAALGLGAALLFPIVLGGLLALVASFAGPDSPLYAGKRLTESVVVALHPDPVGRAGVEIDLAETRRREAEDMAARGQGDLAVGAERERFDELRAATAALAASRVRNASWRAARDRLRAAAGLPIDQVEGELAVSGHQAAADSIKALDAAYQGGRQTQERGLDAPPAGPRG